MKDAEFVILVLNWVSYFCGVASAITTVLHFYPLISVVCCVVSWGIFAISFADLRRRLGGPN